MLSDKCIEDIHKNSLIKQKDIKTICSISKSRTSILWKWKYDFVHTQSW